MPTENDPLYLGIVRWGVTGDNPRGPYVQLEPLYELASDGMKWQPIESAQLEFPNQGVVTWFRASDDAAKGTLWRFRIEEQPTSTMLDWDRHCDRQTSSINTILVSLRWDGDTDERRNYGET